jgi:hypothetical protein
MEDLLYATDEDIAFWNRSIEGLPSGAGLLNDGMSIDGEPIPYSCGPHSLRAMRKAIEIVQPKYMVEIGFNIGHSAATWLNLSETNVVSCDISTKTETHNSADFLMKKYPSRFFYQHVYKWKRRDQFLYKDIFDMVFIDGGHLIQDVLIDIVECLDANIPYFFFDDVLPAYGQIQEAIDFFKSSLSLVFEMWNMALYKNTMI